VQNPSRSNRILPSLGSFLQKHVTAAVLMLHLIENYHTLQPFYYSDLLLSENLVMNT
jgi:hypothetical protein